MDVHTSETRSKNMQAIKSRNTSIENALAKKLWSLGYRYRRCNKKIYGRPDFSFSKFKIAIFCDSEFFHGKDWISQKSRIGTNPEFWIKKIESNIIRDTEVNQKLADGGWIVLRFWGLEIKRNLEYCISKIVNSIELRKNDKIL